MKPHWSELGDRLRTICGIVAFGCLAWPTPRHTHAQGPGELTVGELQDRLSQLRQSRDEWFDPAELLDTLYYGWSDEPYLRVELAVGGKVLTCLKREAGLRRRGNGAMPDSTVLAMLAWAEAAWRGPMPPAASDAGNPFRPNRIDPTTPASSGHRAPPVFTFADRATITRIDDRFGDLDLLASLGFRAYARWGADWPAGDAGTTLSARARSLGIVSALIEDARRADAQADPASRAASAESFPTMFVRCSLADLTTGGPARLSSGSTIAVADRADGEALSSWRARRAAARALSGERRHAVAGWAPPSAPSSPGAARTQRVAAAMWIDALDGLMLGVLPGWRDLRDGTADAPPSALTDPELISAVARTALDILRLSAYLEPFHAQTAIVVVIDADAVASDDPNRWAAWIAPYLDVLSTRSSRFEIAFAGRGPRAGRLRPASGVPVRRPAAGGDVAALSQFSRLLDDDAASVPAVSVVEVLPARADDLFVAAAEDPTGTPSIAVVNWSNRARSVRIESAKRLPAMRDVITGAGVDGNREAIAMAPWQVRLLVPAASAP